MGSGPNGRSARTPEGGWPLDDLFVGIVTLRTVRELLARERRYPGSDWRAYDLYLRIDASLPGCTKAARRLAGIGVFESLPPADHWSACSYRLDPTYPLLDPLRDLFFAERRLVRARSRLVRGMW